MKPCQKEIAKFFLESQLKFEALCNHLTVQETLTHSEIEDYLWVEGRELLRQMQQNCLELRSAQEETLEKVIGPDQVVRKANRHHSRELTTLFGKVKIKRKAYSAPGFRSLYPLDKTLNLPKCKYSYGIQAFLCSESGLRSFDETLREMASVVGGHVPKRQAEQVVASASQDFEKYYAQAIAIETKASILVISLDGKGIVMRPEDLNSEQYHKKMATVSTVYCIVPFVRTPTEIVSSLHPGKTKQKEPEPRPKPQGKKVWASLESSVEQVVAHCFREAQKIDPERNKHRVALVDGNLTQQRCLKREAKRQGVSLTIILDFIHVSEYVWTSAKALNVEHLDVWVQDKLLKILQGQSSLVAAAIRRRATCQRLSGPARKEADNCANYLLNQKACMRYDQYLRQGFPIATGVIEGACRYLVKDRMDRTGARWRISGAEAVLKMRALKSNEDFQAYWAFHQAQAFERNYADINVFPKRKDLPLNNDYEMDYAS